MDLPTPPYVLELKEWLSTKFERIDSKLERLSDSVDEIRGLIVKKKSKKVRNLKIIIIIITIMFVFVNSTQNAIWSPQCSTNIPKVHR